MNEIIKKLENCVKIIEGDDTRWLEYLSVLALTSKRLLEKLKYIKEKNKKISCSLIEEYKLAIKMLEKAEYFLAIKVQILLRLNNDTFEKLSEEKEKALKEMLFLLPCVRLELYKLLVDLKKYESNFSKE